MTLGLQTMSSICTMKRRRIPLRRSDASPAEGPALFATNPALRLEIPSALLGADVWDSLEIVMLEPVLLVTTSQPTEDGIHASRTFLVKARHLATMRRSKEVRIDTVDLLSPARVNGNGEWRLHRLNEVWECRDARDTHTAWLFRAVNGAEFCDSPVGDSPSTLVRDRRVFSAPVERKSSGVRAHPGEERHQNDPSAARDRRASSAKGGRITNSAQDAR
ncbi:MAG: hypothetical protein JWP60_3054 [Ramlibacter sp.]|nr:hypothetical protein [Ramlibacter sp.]